MVLMAAARGLASFKSLPQVRDDILKPLARRTSPCMNIDISVILNCLCPIGLMGDTNEVLRENVVEKAIGDPQVIFFMSDLESVRLFNSSFYVVTRDTVLHT